MFGAYAFRDICRKLLCSLVNLRSGMKRFGSKSQGKYILEYFLRSDEM